MKTVFVMSLQGVGDDEDAYCVSGVYSTHKAAEAAARANIAERYEEEWEYEEYKDTYEIEEHYILD